MCGGCGIGFMDKKLCDLMSVELKFIGNFKKFNFFKKLIIFGIFQKNLISYKFRRHKNLIAIIKKMSTKRTHDDPAPDQRKRTQPLPSALTGVTSDLGYIVSEPFKRIMHPLLATAFTDEYSWLSRVSECVLAAEISRYLTVDNGVECYPGVLDIGDPYGDFIVAVVNFASRGTQYLEELQISPCGDVRVYTNASVYGNTIPVAMASVYQRIARNQNTEPHEYVHYDSVSQRTFFFDLKNGYFYDQADPETAHMIDMHDDAEMLHVYTVCMDARGRVVIAYECADEDGQPVLRIRIVDPLSDWHYNAVAIGMLQHAERIQVHSMRVRYDGAVLITASVDAQEAVLSMQFQHRLPVMRIVQISTK